MSKFSRVVKFKGDFSVIQHNGTEYREEHEGSGVFEAPHDHADHFNACGFTEDFASTMDEALEKLTADKKAEDGKKPAETKKGA